MRDGILKVYKKLYAKYQDEKTLIPEGNLFEMKFEDFEQDAMGITRDIYRQLQLPGFGEAESSIASYLDSKSLTKRIITPTTAGPSSWLRATGILRLKTGDTSSKTLPVIVLQGILIKLLIHFNIE